jgi:HD superfamily phosphohydrolase YqeK
MKNVRVERIIEMGQELLKKDPFDSGHDFDHHERVVDNIITIVTGEGLKVDLGALKIAGWWHDYKRNTPTECDTILKDSMELEGFHEKYIELVLAIKNNHSYGTQQETIEAKVLFDADKLEYVSVPRFTRVKEAVEKGEMSPEVQEKYALTFSERIPNIYQSLHFKVSKEEFRKRFPGILEFVTFEPRWRSVLEALKKVTF